MKIRMLAIEDIPALLPLFDAYRQFYRKPSDLDAASDFLKKRMLNKEAEIIGAFDDQQMIGFTLLYPLFSSTRMKPIYLLNDLFVHPAHRNRSIGKALLNFSKDFAAQMGRAGVLLETEKSNEVGNHLYPLMGFEAVSDSNFYFWENK